MEEVRRQKKEIEGRKEGRVRTVKRMNGRRGMKPARSLNGEEEAEKEREGRK